MKNKAIKVILSMAVILAAALSFTACGDSGKPSVTIGYFDNVTHAQALIMKSEKTMETKLGDDTDVKWISFNAGPEEIEALLSSEVDIGYIGPVPAVTSNVQSQGDIKLLSGVTNAGAVLVKRADADIESVKDLDGKTVAIPSLGNTQHLNLLKLLSDNGLAPTSEGGTVTVSAVENADVANMMDQKNIDAALVPEPWGTILVEKGAEIVLDYDEIYLDGDYNVAVVVVREDFYKEHPDVVKTFLESHKEATVYINDNKADAEKIVNDMLEEETGKTLSDSVISGAFDRIIFTDEISKESIKGFSEISREQGFINKLPDYDNLYIEVK